MKEVVTWLLGPAGILLGWFLTQHTVKGDGERQARAAAEGEERQRVLDTVRLAREASSLIRSLLHGVYMKDQYKKAPQGFAEMMNEFNSTKDAFRNSVLALRLLGPSWAVHDAERIDVEVSKLAELAFIMQSGVTAAHVASATKDLPLLDQQVNDYVTAVGKMYNSAANELPPHPDMETEARWKPAVGS